MRFTKKNRDDFRGPLLKKGWNVQGDLIVSPTKEVMAQYSQDTYYDLDREIASCLEKARSIEDNFILHDQENESLLNKIKSEWHELASSLELLRDGEPIYDLFARIERQIRQIEFDYEISIYMFSTAYPRCLLEFKNLGIVVEINLDSAKLIVSARKKNIADIDSGLSNFYEDIISASEDKLIIPSIKKAILKAKNMFEKPSPG